MTSYDLCLSIAEEAHKYQLRKDNETPYIEHPKAGVRILKEQFDIKREDILCAAILHDVVEDTGLTFDDLKKKGVSNEVVRLVDILTRRQGQTYFDYLMRVLEDKDASMIKYADLKHNSSDLTSGSLRDKYELAMYIISQRWF